MHLNAFLRTHPYRLGRGNLSVQVGAVVTSKPLHEAMVGGSEAGGVKPKVPRPGIRVPSSTSSRYRVSRMRRVMCVTCVPCVRRRARDRSIGRGQSEAPDHRSEARAIFGVLSSCSSCSSLSGARVLVPVDVAMLSQVLFIFSNGQSTILIGHGMDMDTLC